MKPTAPIEVMICCNDPRTGNFLGFLTGFNVDELQINCGWDEDSPEFLFDAEWALAHFADFGQRMSFALC